LGDKGEIGLILFRKSLSCRFYGDKAAHSIGDSALETFDDREVPPHATAFTKIPQLTSRVHALKAILPHDVFQQDHRTYNQRVTDKLSTYSLPPIQQKVCLGTHRSYYKKKYFHYRANIRSTSQLERCTYRTPQIVLSAAIRSLSSKASPRYFDDTFDDTNSGETSDPFDREDLANAKSHLRPEQVPKAEKAVPSSPENKANIRETMATTSKKRKLDEPAPTKYYAVKAGHTPGVYTSWSDCQENITGFRGANCRSWPRTPEYVLLTKYLF
jgi:hypothetical protein